MTELMKNAWLGWLDFTTGGKLAALFLAALVYLWLTGKWKEHRTLFLAEEQEEKGKIRHNAGKSFL